LKIFKGSNKEYLFHCSDCNHNFKTRISNLNRDISDWPCSFCKGDALCENSKDPKKFPDACQTCFDKSFASNYRSEFWSNKNMIKPEKVRKFTKKNFWFICGGPDGCDHEFESCPNNIEGNDSWCPYCSTSTKKLCDNLKCKICENKSFAQSDKAKFIDPSENVDARKISKSSHKLINFICSNKDCGHKFISSPNRITNNHSWCPMCLKKTEMKISKWLSNKFPDLKIIKEAKFDWCCSPESGKNFPFDFYIPFLKLIIEIDGPQHFV
jgi:hypothetical protein